MKAATDTLPAGWMGKQSRRWLKDHAKRSTTVIEIGCWLGRSTKVLARATKGVVFAVDHWMGTPDDPEQHDKLYAEHVLSRDLYAEFRLNLSQEIASGKVIPLPLSSAVAAEVLRDAHGLNWCDFLFIDGDHSYEGCLADIDHYTPLVKAGGVISGHDFHWPGVRKAVTERFRKPHVVLGPSSIWSVRKRA